MNDMPAILLPVVICLIYDWIIELFQIFFHDFDGLGEQILLVIRRGQLYNIFVIFMETTVTGI